MFLTMTGEQLGLDEDQMFDEFEVELCDDHLEDDKIRIITVLDNDCDVSHLIDEETTGRHVRAMLEVMRDGVSIEREAMARGIDL
tara:strand:+ start:14866 stop:15120 length:255 start_codon:yes stop_codon:yes gene_type:complete